MDMDRAYRLQYSSPKTPQHCELITAGSENDKEISTVREKAYHWKSWEESKSLVFPQACWCEQGGRAEQLQCW